MPNALRRASRCSEALGGTDRSTAPCSEALGGGDRPTAGCSEVLGGGDRFTAGCSEAIGGTDRVIHRSQAGAGALNDNESCHCVTVASFEESTLRPTR